MTDISDDTHVDKAEAWDRNHAKNVEIARLKAALRHIVQVDGHPSYSQTKIARDALDYKAGES